MTNLLPKFLQHKKTETTTCFKGVVVDIDNEEIISDFDPMYFLRFAYNNNESIVILAAKNAMNRLKSDNVSLSELYSEISKRYSSFPLENLLTILQIGGIMVDKTETHHHYEFQSDTFHRVNSAFIEAAQEHAKLKQQ